jgi:hypothetical protein
MIIKGELLPEQRLEDLLDEADQLRKIIGQSINTAKENRHSPFSAGWRGQFARAPARVAAIWVCQIGRNAGNNFESPKCRNPDPATLSLPSASPTRACAGPSQWENF